MSRQKGFSLVELLIVVAIVALLSAIVIPLLNDATTRARRMALAADLDDLHKAFLRYHVDHGKFPADSGADKLDLTTLSPLSTEGYFRGVDTLLSKLQGNKIQFYTAPNLNGIDADYILRVRSRDEASLFGFTTAFSVGVVAIDGVYFKTKLFGPYLRLGELE